MIIHIEGIIKDIEVIKIIILVGSMKVITEIDIQVYQMDKVFIDRKRAIRVYLLNLGIVIMEIPD